MDISIPGYKQAGWLATSSGFLSPAFPILATHPEVCAMGNPLQSAGTEHHKLFLLWSGQPAPQPAATRRQPGRDESAVPSNMPVSSREEHAVWMGSRPRQAL